MGLSADIGRLALLFVPAWIVISTVYVYVTPMSHRPGECKESANAAMGVALGYVVVLLPLALGITHAIVYFNGRGLAQEEMRHICAWVMVSAACLYTQAAYSHPHPKWCQYQNIKAATDPYHIETCDDSIALVDVKYFGLEGSWQVDWKDVVKHDENLAAPILHAGKACTEGLFAWCPAKDENCVHKSTVTDSFVSMRKVAPPDGGEGLYFDMTVLQPGEASMIMEDIDYIHLATCYKYWMIWTWAVPLMAITQKLTWLLFITLQATLPSPASSPREVLVAF